MLFIALLRSDSTGDADDGFVFVVNYGQPLIISIKG
jgi:hypothetical protein